MTLRDIEASAAKSKLALIVIRDGRPSYVDLEDEMMRKAFAPVIEALEAGERDLLAAYGEETRRA